MSKKGPAPIYGTPVKDLTGPVKQAIKSEYNDAAREKQKASGNVAINFFVDKETKEAFTQFCIDNANTEGYRTTKKGGVERLPAGEGLRLLIELSKVE